jgi:ABC-type uncharacterized transport system permease subunit
MTHNVPAPPQADLATSLPASTVSAESHGISFENLASTDRWRFVWGFFWRSLCIAVLSMLGGALAGAVIGFVTVVIAQVLGKSLSDVLLLIRVLSGLAGLLVGFAALWLLMRWCFRAKWFGYRLRLVRDVA